MWGVNRNGDVRINRNVFRRSAKHQLKKNALTRLRIRCHMANRQTVHIGSPWSRPVTRWGHQSI